jgi:hypothetical protein
MFALLTDATAALTSAGAFPSAVRLAALDGPARTFTPSTGALRSTSYPWTAFEGAVRDTAAYCRAHRRMPDEVWIGAENLSPSDYLATLGSVVEGIAGSGRIPRDVPRRAGRFTSDRYVAEDSPKLWGWVIFPDGFHAPRIMELARIQAWTLKPARLSPAQSHP